LQPPSCQQHKQRAGKQLVHYCTTKWHFSTHFGPVQRPAIYTSVPSARHCSSQCISQHPPVIACCGLLALVLPVLLPLPLLVCAAALWAAALHRSPPAGGSWQRLWAVCSSQCMCASWACTYHEQPHAVMCQLGCLASMRCAPCADRCGSLNAAHTRITHGGLKSTFHLQRYCQPMQA
jgi:hypothetical protein